MTKTEKNQPFQEVGARIKMIRDDFGRADESGRGETGRWSQLAMAEKMGCSVPTWSEYESGRTLPAPKVLQGLIAERYDANWILSGIGSMRISGGNDWTLDKLAFSTVLELVLREIESAGLNLPTDKITKIMTRAYKDYQTKNNIEELKDNISEYIEMVS